MPAQRLLLRFERSREHRHRVGISRVAEATRCAVITPRCVDGLLRESLAECRVVSVSNSGRTAGGHWHRRPKSRLRSGADFAANVATEINCPASAESRGSPSILDRLMRCRAAIHDVVVAQRASRAKIETSAARAAMLPIRLARRLKLGIGENFGEEKVRAMTIQQHRVLAEPSGAPRRPLALEHRTGIDIVRVIAPTEFPRSIPRPRARPSARNRDNRARAHTPRSDRASSAPINCICVG